MYHALSLALGYDVDRINSYFLCLYFSCVEYKYRETHSKQIDNRSNAKCHEEKQNLS